MSNEGALIGSRGGFKGSALCAIGLTLASLGLPQLAGCSNQSNSSPPAASPPMPLRTPQEIEASLRALLLSVKEAHQSLDEGCTGAEESPPTEKLTLALDKLSAKLETAYVDRTLGSSLENLAVSTKFVVDDARIAIQRGAKFDSARTRTSILELEGMLDKHIEILTPKGPEQIKQEYSDMRDQLNVVKDHVHSALETARKTPGQLLAGDRELLRAIASDLDWTRDALLKASESADSQEFQDTFGLAIAPLESLRKTLQLETLVRSWTSPSLGNTQTISTIAKADHFELALYKACLACEQIIERHSPKAQNDFIPPPVVMPPPVIFTS